MNVFDVLRCGVVGQVGQMSQVNAYDILKYGVIGLGFLLAFLAYRLLVNEQRKPQASKPILVAIHVFMIFSLLLCVIGFASEYFGGAKSDVDIEKFEVEIKRLQLRVAEQEKELALRERNLVKYRENQQQIQDDSKKAREVAQNVIQALPDTIFGVKVSFKEDVKAIVNLLKFREIVEDRNP